MFTDFSSTGCGLDNTVGIEEDNNIFVIFLFIVLLVKVIIVWRKLKVPNVQHACIYIGETRRGGQSCY